MKGIARYLHVFDETVEGQFLFRVRGRFIQRRNSLLKRFPDVCPAIKLRHADFKSRQAAKGKSQGDEEIKPTADLNAEGKRPSMPPGKSRMS
jgi:hypothetical protein